MSNCNVKSCVSGFSWASNSVNVIHVAIFYRLDIAISIPNGSRIETVCMAHLVGAPVLVKTVALLPLTSRALYVAVRVWEYKMDSWEKGSRHDTNDTARQKRHANHVQLASACTTVQNTVISWDENMVYRKLHKISKSDIIGQNSSELCGIGRICNLA